VAGGLVIWKRAADSVSVFRKIIEGGKTVRIDE
jgi:hypothetical protein